MAYVNRADKEIIVTLSGCIGYAEVLEGTTYHNSKKAKRSVAALKNHAIKALDAIMADLDTDQVRGCLRTAQNSELMLIPHSDPRTKYDSYIVPAEVFDRLVMEPVGECSFCTKEGKEVKKCQRRRDLAACAVVAGNGGECPYQM